MGRETRKSQLSAAAAPAWAARAAIILITIYQRVVSPILGAWGVRCRFYPSCSQYAIDALRAYGFWRGLFQAIKRLLKCHPLHPGGYDPA